MFMILLYDLKIYRKILYRDTEHNFILNAVHKSGIIFVFFLSVFFFLFSLQMQQPSLIKSVAFFSTRSTMYAESKFQRTDTYEFLEMRETMAKSSSTI